MRKDNAQMVTAVQPAQYTNPGWLGVFTDEHPYRGESAAPPPGEAERVRQLVSDDPERALKTILGLGEWVPTLGTNARLSATMALKDLCGISSLSSPADGRLTVEVAYETLREIFCTSAFGIKTAWPQHFWDTLVGKLVYVAFYDAYGEDLLLNQDVAETLGLHLSRVGQVQRLGLMGYIENPYVAHRMQRRRRVAPYMIEGFRSSIHHQH